MPRKTRLKDDYGVPVTPGCTIVFSYGIPPVVVEAEVVERDGRLIALTPGHTPSECPVADLRDHVGGFWVRERARLTRTREKIMREWDDIRARIAGGCTNSGPRDWLEGVLDEQDREIDRLRRALKLIASGMLGDKVLSELELSGIASETLEKVP